MKKNLAIGWLLCLLVFGLSSFAQSGRVVTGKVVDETGMKLEGVSVSVKGTSTIVVTNNEGRFSIEMPLGKNWLTFSYVGFSSADINVGQANDLNVKLQSTAADAGEAVVVGYGTQKRKTLTSAVSKIGELKPEENVTANFINSLQGKVAGLTIMNASATPGAMPYFSIRGQQVARSSAGEFITPLIVVDGMILETGVINTDVANLKLSNLNPQDIESIEVLKDAASAAIYGARGSQGVILITTKRGRLNTRPNVSLNAYYGVNTAKVNFRPLNVEEYKNLFITARQNRINDINNATNSESVTLQNQIKALTDPTNVNSLYYKGKYDVNWIDFLLPGSSNTYNVQASMSGGSDKSTYYFSTGYYSQDNANGPGNFTRQSVKLALTQQVTDWFKLNGELTANHSLTKRMLDLYTYGVSIRPDSPTDIVKNADGTFGYTYGTQFNPLAQLAGNNGRSETWNLLANIGAEFKLYKGLQFRSNISGVKNDGRNSSFLPWYGSTALAAINGRATSGYNNGLSYTWNNLLTYNFRFKQLDATAMVGHEYYYTKSDLESVSYTGFPRIEGLTFPSNASALDAFSPFGTSLTEQGSESFFGRANLSWAGKYLLNLSLRRDESSLLGDANRKAVFPAISGGWMLSQENFMKHVDFINTLKLRASWGKTGSLRTLSYFTYMPLVTVSSYMGQSSLVPGGNLANPDLRWEATHQYDMGLDVSMLQNSISLSLDYYDRTTKDFITTVPVPTNAGLGGHSQKFVNLGSLKNSGIDIELTVRNKPKSKVKWAVTGVGNFNKNKMIELAKDPTLLGLVLLGGSPSFTYSYAIKGRPLGTAKLLQADGVDPQTGDLKYIDQNKDGLINADDQVWYDLGQPKFTGGLNFNVGYAGITFSGALVANVGRKVYDYASSAYRSSTSYALSGGVMANRPNWVLDDMWQKPGDVAHYPRAIYGQAGPTNQPATSRANWNNLGSTHWLVNGDFMRVQNLTLSYNLPKEVVNKAKMQAVRFYLSGQNLFLLKNKYNTSSDPEILYSGMVNSAAAPIARTYTFGIDLNF